MAHHHNLGDTRNVTVETIMRRAAFQAGVEDAACGLRLDAKSWETRRDQWDYERGRLWAIATGRTSVRFVRGRVSKVDAEAYCRCMHAGTFPLGTKRLPTADELGL